MINKNPSLFTCHSGTVKGAMIFRCLITLFLITHTFILCVPVGNSQEKIGKIHGKLIDEQLNKPIANHPITLNIHKADDVKRQEAETDEKGVYQFDNLTIDFATHYTISTTYNDVEHIEKNLVLSSLVPNLTVDIKIGGITDDPSQISIKTYSIALGFTSDEDVKKGVLSIFEVFVVENKDSLPFQTTQNSEKVGLYFALPKGHEMFQPLSPQNLKLNAAADHVILTDPIEPGELEGGFAYAFKTKGRNIRLSRPMHFRTDQITILVPEGIRIVPRSKLFEPAGHTQFHGIVYTKYTASPEGGFPMGRMPDMSLAILEPPNTGKSNIGQMIFIAIAASLAGGFLVAAIFMLRGTNQRSVERDSSADVLFDAGWLRKLNDTDLEHVRAARLEFISYLDGLHEKQEISERVYNRIRKEQTERLAEILEQRKERGLGD